MKSLGTKLVYPAAADPRWLQFAFLLAFDVYAMNSPGFNRSPGQFAATIATCLGLELFFNWRKGGPIILPVSGMISAFGLLLLCDSPFLWPYFVIAALSILSKHLLTVDGRHIFNPTNFGLVVGLLFLSPYMHISPGRWGGTVAGMAAVAALGALTCWRARRLELCVSYVLTFAAGAYLQHLLYGQPVRSYLAPMTGSAFQLFVFFMISDPMTTPESAKGRWLYGFLIGLFDTIFSCFEVVQGRFFAPFLLTGLLPLLRHWFPRSLPEDVWRTRTLALGR